MSGLPMDSDNSAPPAAGAPPAAQADDEDDLFGSEDEGGAVAPVSNATTPAVSTPGANPMTSGGLTQGINTPSEPVASGTPAATVEALPYTNTPSSVPLGPGRANIGAVNDSSSRIGGTSDGFHSSPLPGADDDKASSRDLFGDSADDVDDKDLFGSEIDVDEKDLEIDEKDLFGDDDDEDADMAGRPAVAPTQVPGSVPPSQDGGTPQPQPPTPSDMFSEMDEREIFGDISDDDLVGDKLEDVTLLRRPAPTGERPIASLRLPNVLSIERKAFKASAVGQYLLDGYKEMVAADGTQWQMLLGSENCIRWQFQKGEDGEILTDEDGRPKYISNSRMVEWEDGTRTLYVGDEAFACSYIADKVCLYEENSQDIHVCHGVINTRIVATPNSLNSITHDELKKSQYRKYRPVRRSLLMTPEEQEDAKQVLELTQEQDKRREKLQKKAIAPSAPAAEAIDAKFLEDDAPHSNSGSSKRESSRDDKKSDGIGPSVTDLKRDLKRKRPSETA